MGRKGVSKRKPKRSDTSSGGNSKAQSSGGSAVQTLVKDKGAPTNKSQKKH